VERLFTLSPNEQIGRKVFVFWALLDHQIAIGGSDDRLKGNEPQSKAHVDMVSPK
jgi:hypothetical protein